MDLKAATVLVRRHLVSLIIVLLVFAGAGGMLLKGYLAVQDKREQLDARDLKLKTRQVELDEQEFLLNQQGKILQQQEQNLAQQSKLLEHKESNTASELVRLQKKEQALSARAEEKQIDERVQKIASSISELGGITDIPDCNDTEAVRRYREALSKVRELVALSAAGNHLAAKYENAFDSSMYAPGDCFTSEQPDK